MIVENHGTMSQGSNNEANNVIESSKADLQVAGRIESFSFQKSPGLQMDKIQHSKNMMSQP